MGGGGYYSNEMTETGHERRPFPDQTPHLPYRLALYFFAYYAITGAFVPFWPLYLQKRGLGADTIAACMAAAAFTRFAMPLAWGWWMDRTGRRMVWINIAIGVCALFFAAMAWPKWTALGLVLLHLGYAVFWNAIFPAFDVVALGHVARHRAANATARADYGRVRLWGSIGFIVTVLGLGVWYQSHHIRSLPWVIVGGMAALAGMGLLVPDDRARGAKAIDPEPDAGMPRFQEALRSPGLGPLLFAGFMAQLSFSPYYGFYSIWLQGFAYPRGAIGGLWALAVVAEVVVFTNVRRLMERFGAQRLMACALAVTGGRWVLVGALPQSVTVVVLAQILHFASFGFYHPASLALIGEYFPGRLAGRGQALLMAATYGLGGFVGYLLTGPAWTALGGRAVFFGAAIAALLGLWVFSRRREPHGRVA